MNLPPVVRRCNFVLFLGSSLLLLFSLLFCEYSGCICRVNAEEDEQSLATSVSRRNAS